MFFTRTFMVLMLLTTCVNHLFALDYVKAKHEEAIRIFTGRIIAEDKEGNLIIEERDGRWFPLHQNDILERTSDDKVFAPLTKNELITQLKKELPPSFRIHHTSRYVIAYDTTRAYAQWCGSFLERLDTAFIEQWKNKGLEVNEPEFLLVAFVIADRNLFIRATNEETGGISNSISAYYNQNSNRIIMYDMTGEERWSDKVDASISNRRIREFMARSGSDKLVTTFIHEATHQISFNSGLQQRCGDSPIWVSEGIALLYETPDYNSRQGWSSNIKVNLNRLIDFYKYVNKKRPLAPIRDLVVSDDLFKKEPLSAYATAWAVMYYFNQKRPDELTNYLKTISKKEPFVKDDTTTRISDFEEAFGSDWDQLHHDFYDFIRKINN